MINAISQQTVFAPTLDNSRSGAANRANENDARSKTQQQAGDPVQLSAQARQQAGDNSGKNAAELQLNQQELEKLRTLKQRDTEVRTHEQAHLSTAGPYAKGSPSFTYQKGPDGNSYAIGGEVGIDLSTERSPEETIKKMQTIKRAALAPANPSPADRQIAAQASAKEAKARQELGNELQEDLLGGQSQQSTASPSAAPFSQSDANGNRTAVTDTSSGILKQRDAAYRTIAAV